MLKPLAIDHLKIHKDSGNKAVLKKLRLFSENWKFILTPEQDSPKN